MIYTSYLGNLKNIPDNIEKVSIMRFTPKWSKEYIDDIYTRVAPSKELLLKYKNKEITDEEYTIEYNKMLSNINPKTLKKKLDGKVLLCSCKLGTFCHRHLLAEYLTDNDVPVAEIPPPHKLVDIKVEITDELSVKKCKANRNKIYVFGDNVLRKGKAGQAIIRNCKNSFGVITKRYPNNKHDSYLKDNEFDLKLVMNDLTKLRYLMYKGNTIVFPRDGLGTGLAQLGLHAPKIHIKMFKYIEKYFMRYLDEDRNRYKVIVNKKDNA